MLELSEVRAGYGKSRILDGVSMTAPAGQIVALLGGNGTGKSTTLKTIVGQVRPESGTITFDGSRIEGVATHKMIARGLCLVPQGKEVFAAMSVEENLLMGAFHRHGDRVEIPADLDGCYARFPRIAERRQAPAGALSGGERQMLAIGRALMSRPKLLMLDEPSAALAPKIIAEIGEAILALKEAGMTILLVEQNVSVALDLAQYLYIMRDGRIAFERPVSADLAVDDLREFYLGARQ